MQFQAQPTLTLTGVSNLKLSWSNDLPSLSEIFLNGPILSFMTDGKDSRCAHYSWLSF
jgi:hypothetical protein